MRVKGRTLSEEERARIYGPYLKNAGQKWDLATVKDYVHAGADAIENNIAVRSEINKGIQSLGIKRGSDNGEI
jgi:hypothetical protein